VAALGVVLLGVGAPARASDSTFGDDPIALPAPLSVGGFTAAVLSHNSSLEAMHEAVLAATGRIKPAASLDDPMMSISVAPRSFGSSVGPSGDVEVSQALPWWGTLDARAEVARAEAEAAADDLSALRLQLAALARGAFSDWVFVHRALDINRANESVLADLRSIATVRYTTGQGPQSDILQADVARSMLKEQRFELERDQATVQARMNALLERSPQAVIPVPAALPEISRPPAEELLARRALEHPVLGQLEAQEHAAAAREQLAEKERYPKFAVSAGYNNMWSDPTMRPMVGVSISIPLNRGKYRADVDAARAEARRSSATLLDQRSALLADLAAAYASAAQAGQSVALYRDELVPLSLSTLEVARADYGAGRGQFLSVLTASQHQLDAELGLARSQSEYFQRLADLEHESGGGLFDDTVKVGANP
jgi:outer membrane protein TolC